MAIFSPYRKGPDLMMVLYNKGIGEFLKVTLLSLMFILCTSLFAAVPDPIVTGTDSYNGYATVSGRLNAKPDRPVGISVRNGNTIASTVTDSDGRWSIVFRHRSVQYTVTAWDISSPGDLAKATGELAISDELQ